MTAIDRYLGLLASRLREVVGADLVGVYAGGSYALGGYEPRRSDVDVAAVVGAALSHARKEEIVAAVRHEALPCPARGLELVVYALAAVREPRTDAAFELNLNTGAGMSFRLDLEPDPAEGHWFPIDRSILAAHGVALHGPPSADVFAPIPRDALLPVLATALRRQGGHPDAVPNAWRALRYAREGVWSSKREAHAWARSGGVQADPAAVAAELAAL